MTNTTNNTNTPVQTRMINVLVNSTTFANGIAGSYDFCKENAETLKDLRVTEAKGISESIYRRELDTAKMQSLFVAGETDKAQRLASAIDKECTRVGALNALLEELKSIEAIADNYDIILCYVPTLLKREIESGKIKFHIFGGSVSSYYSDIELLLWDELLPILQNLYCKLVFKDINSCKTNSYKPNNIDSNNIDDDTAEEAGVTAQDLRVEIYKRQYSVMVKKFGEEKRKARVQVNAKKAVNQDF